jgi:hypothetical protein
MPRPERALDTTAGPLPRFAADLRELRTAAGGMPYRQMARTANYSPTVLSEAAAGRRLPTLAVTLAYVAACGGDQDEWRTRWHTLAAETGTTSPDNSAATTDSPSTTDSAGTMGSAESQRRLARQRPRRPRAVAVLAVVVVVLLAAVIVLLISPDREQAANRIAPGGAMPEHMVPLNAEATEGIPARGEPAPNLPCSTPTAAIACLDITAGQLWVRDVPPGDGHHAAGYWATTDGKAHGECHNYSTSEGPWATCHLPDLPDGARIGMRAAVVEKEVVLTWGPYTAVTIGR